MAHKNRTVVVSRFILSRRFLVRISCKVKQTLLIIKRLTGILLTVAYIYAIIKWWMCDSWLTHNNKSRSLIYLILYTFSFKVWHNKYVTPLLRVGILRAVGIPQECFRALASTVEGVLQLNSDLAEECVWRQTRSSCLPVKHYLMTTCIHSKTEARLTE